MTSFFDRYNLSAFERRLVVFVGIAVFLVLNMVFVWPRFGEWKSIQADMAKTKDRIGTYQRMISQAGALNEKLRSLESGGTRVVPDQRANQLMRTIQDVARKSKLPFADIKPVRSTTRAAERDTFFDQKAYTLGVTTDDEELIQFLVAIGNDESMIRVRDLELKPEPPQRTRLTCRMTLVANYLKQAAAASANKDSSRVTPNRPTRVAQNP